jgi:hypothetical protein
MPLRGKVFDDVHFANYPSAPTISLGQQVMRCGPFADTAASLQSILACRSEVNAPVYPAQCSFLSCILARRKAAVHSGEKIRAGRERQIFRPKKERERSRGGSAERAVP